MKKVSLFICLFVMFGCSSSKFISVYNKSTIRIDERGNYKVYPRNSSTLNRMRFKYFLKGKELNIIDSSSVRVCEMIKSDTIFLFSVTKGNNTEIFDARNESKITISKYSAINIECPM